MPQKLETVLKHVEEINNDVNRQLIYEYHKYLVFIVTNDFKSIELYKSMNIVSTSNFIAWVITIDLNYVLNISKIK